MGLLTKLQSEGSDLSGFDGTTPPSAPDQAESTLHKTYSINGNPTMPDLPTPSELDLNGVTPPKYLDNLPE